MSTTDTLRTDKTITNLADYMAEVTRLERALAAEKARAEKAESQVRTLRDALEGVMSTLREGWIPEDVYDTARSALASTAPKP